ncbi:DUF1993 family protein [Lysobacter cavernae]|uniref:DUF1993 family protein n=1 Tax=Lysobacter cavernae TaxID=1685901 RepID=A0ABV7RP02_9GAMM
MSLSMHQATVPVFVRSLKNLRRVLEKGEAHARAKNITPDALLESRLIDDMLPLRRNVQIATDMAKNGSARLAAVDPLKFEDNETTFDELYVRIDRAIDYIGSFDTQQLGGSEQRTVSFRTQTWGELRYEGPAYLTEFLLPNFFFHCTTCYAILRKAGVELGKKDYLGLA